MERRPPVTEVPLDAIAISKFRQQYIEELFKSYPDTELLADMWEIDPVTMNGLMPEVGLESQPALFGENENTLAIINILRRLYGVEQRHRLPLPAQRIHEAWQGLPEEEKANTSFIPTSRLDNWEADAILKEADLYFTVVGFVTRRQVMAEIAREDRRAG